ncbi:MAG: hypothetical protein Q9169_005888 [Polycauliona sp. 2 TL-2023]
MDDSTQPHPTHCCVQCGKAAFSACCVCLNSPGGESTWYCGLQCQKDNWPNHKTACKALAARKILYRAADTAQAMFYVYREIAFDKLIVKVKRTKGQLWLFEGQYQDEILVPFPEALIKDENEKKAVLTYLACGDAYGYLDVLLKTMLAATATRLRQNASLPSAGVSTNFAEINFKLRAKFPLKLRLFYDALNEDRFEYQHEALKVRLKDGSVHVIDLAGSQYGHNVPAMPYDTYLKTMAADGTIPTEHPFGSQRQNMVRACTIPLVPLHLMSFANTDIRKVNEHLYQTLNKCLNSWQSMNTSLPSMLKMKEKDYLDNQKDLLAATGMLLRDTHFKNGKFIGDFRKSPTSVTPPPKAKTKERSFEEDCAELLKPASASGRKVLDMRGVSL